jgi:hypothetical protein
MIKLPFSVAYRPVCSEWDALSNPHIVNADGVLVLAVPQSGVHPGVRDTAALNLAHFVVSSINANIPSTMSPECLLFLAKAVQPGESHAEALARLQNEVEKLYFDLAQRDKMIEILMKKAGVELE